jgi:hypothetical protein
MNPNNLDKILSSENRIEPSSAFTENVMLRVQAEALRSQQKPFPWIRFAASMLIMTVLSIWFFPTDLVLQGINSLSHFIADWIAAPHLVSPLQNALLSGSASILGSLLLVWLSLRLAGVER